MKFSIIGCGRIATNHIKACIENNIKISAVCDIIPENMESLLKKHNLHMDSTIKRFTDYKEMLKEVEPTLVSIATESGKHAEIALECIDFGAHLIIEKPIALSIEDANKIVKHGREKKVKICACHQNRFNVSMQHIRTAVDKNRFGTLSHGTVHVRWNRNQDYYTQAPWRGTWEQDGGALMNQCIHGIDMLRWMMGNEVEEVFAFTKNQYHPYIEAEDIGVAVIKFGNGALGTIEGTTNVFPQNLEETLYLFGEKGTVKAGGKSLNAIDEWKFADKQEVDEHLSDGFFEEVANIYGNGHTSVYKDMLRAIQNNEEPYINGEDGRRAVELVLAIYKSAHEGKPVKLPVVECSTLDFK